MKGSRHGAHRNKILTFKLRSGRGTLFLDEIGDLLWKLQPKILRVHQDRQYERRAADCAAARW